MKHLFTVLMAILLVLIINRANAFPAGTVSVASVNGAISNPIVGAPNQNYIINVLQSPGYVPAASIQYADASGVTVNANWYVITSLTSTGLTFGGRILYSSPQTPGIWAFYNRFTFSIADEGNNVYLVNFRIANYNGSIILLNDVGYLNPGAIVNL